MSVPMSIMGTPDPHRNLIRDLIEARQAYERVCGFPPTLIYVNGTVKRELERLGFKAGAEVAGMKILASPESVADMAICSRDPDLFMFDPKPPRGKAKK